VQEYGPVIGHPDFPEVSELVWISEQAFLKCSEHVNRVDEIYSTDEGRVYTILMYHALNVSYSVRLLTTYAQLLEGHALLRTRLEQVIKCSYLLHADPEDGIIPFMQDVGRVDHGMAQYIKRQDSDRMCARILGPVGRLISAKTQQLFEVLIQEYRGFARDVLGAGCIRSKSAVAPGCST